jgi:Trk-type K+ transport system membrane component
MNNDKIEQIFFIILMFIGSIRIFSYTVPLTVLLENGRKNYLITSTTQMVFI